MALNDQAILAEWSKQRDNEDGDEWRWRIGDPPNDICEAYCRVADAADAAAAARMGGRGGGGAWWSSLTGLRVGEEEREDLWTLSGAQSIG
jgi:hypothetical protein